MNTADRTPDDQKILFFINKMKTGGAEKVFAEEMEALAHEGYAVYLGLVYGSEIPRGFPTERAFCPRFRGIWDIPALWRLVSFVRAKKITHIFATLEHASIIARLAGFILWNRRIVISEPGMANRKPFRYKCLDIILNVRTDLIMSVSSGVRESLLRYQPFYKYKMTVVLNGVHVPVLRPARTQSSPFAVLAVGSLRREKGFEFLIKAFNAFLTEGGAQANLVIIGKGFLEGALNRQIKELGLTDHVQLLGERSHAEVEEWYRRAGCFVLSSVSEGCPNVLLEALALGTPTIATRVAGAVDIVENGISGLLVPIGSADELSRALTRLVSDASLREKIGEGGYRRVRDNFSFEAHLKNIKQALALG